MKGDQKMAMGMPKAAVLKAPKQAVKKIVKAVVKKSIANKLMKKK